MPDPQHLQGQLLPPPTEKRPRPVVGRVEQQVAERPALDNPAAIDQNDLLRQPSRLGDVVRHEDDRFAEAGVQAQKLVLNRLARARVERPERLIHEEEVGVGGQRRATPTRCLWPPDSSAGVRRPNRSSGRPIISRTSATRRRTRARGQPSSRGTVATFADTSRCGKRPPSWTT